MQKATLKSKAVWGGLLVAIGGVATAVGLYLQGQMDMASLFQQVVPLIGTGLGIIGIRVAQK